MDLKLSKNAEKFLSKCETFLGKRIHKNINELLINPYIGNFKKLKGNNFSENIFRVIVGNYRILYEIDLEKNTLIIEKIDKISNIYKIKEEVNEEDQ